MSDCTDLLRRPDTPAMKVSVEHIKLSVTSLLAKDVAWSESDMEWLLELINDEADRLMSILEA